MADFCKGCSEEHFGRDTGDLLGLSTKEDTQNGLYPLVLCEGCGPIQVDHTGKCISVDCKVCQARRVFTEGAALNALKGQPTQSSPPCGILDDKEDGS